MVFHSEAGEDDPSKHSQNERVSQKGPDGCVEIYKQLLDPMHIPAQDKVLLFDVTAEFNVEWALCAKKMLEDNNTGSGRHSTFFAAPTADITEHNLLESRVYGILLQDWWPKQAEFHQRFIDEISPIPRPALELFAFGEKPVLPALLDQKFVEDSPYCKQWLGHLKAARAKVEVHILSQGVPNPNADLKIKPDVVVGDIQESQTAVLKEITFDPDTKAQFTCKGKHGVPTMFIDENYRLVLYADPKDHAEPLECGPLELCGLGHGNFNVAMVI